MLISKFLDMTGTKHQYVIDFYGLAVLGFFIILAA